MIGTRAALYGSLALLMGVAGVSQQGPRPPGHHEKKLANQNKKVRPMQTFRHVGVQGVMVTPDGTRLISWSEDGTIRVWPLEGGPGMAMMPPHPPPRHHGWPPPPPRGWGHQLPPPPGHGWGPPPPPWGWDAPPDETTPERSLPTPPEGSMPTLPEGDDSGWRVNSP